MVPMNFEDSCTVTQVCLDLEDISGLLKSFLTPPWGQESLGGVAGLEVWSVTPPLAVHPLL